MRRSVLIALSLVLAACAGPAPAGSTAAPSAATTTAGPPGPDPAPTVTTPTAAPRSSRGEMFPPAPPVPSGPLAAGVRADLDAIVADLPASLPRDIIDRLGDAGDPRVGWFLTDLLRFSGGETGRGIAAVFEQLAGVELDDPVPWVEATDLLIAWDVPAPPGYREMKGAVFTAVEPAWAPFFADAGSEVDWRFVSWGGVFIDDRADATGAAGCPRGCIPALDDPGVTPAAGGDWYPDDRIVFGVVVDGEARAYPKHMMETHEMVNDELGGRRIALPYCTLCGSAQAYFTDAITGFPDARFRTSGLLFRSNKLMFELTTFSMFDTFLGIALTGPMREAGVELPQVSVVTSSWGAWKRDHPDTTILAEDGGVGRRYELDPLGGRDDAGPIFPVGPVDPRLPVSEPVLGVIAGDGTPVAFPVGAALLALDRGEQVAAAGLVVTLDGGGLRAAFADGSEATAHQAFWFAWSQFHPDTIIWER